MFKIIFYIILVMYTFALWSLIGMQKWKNCLLPPRTPRLSSWTRMITLPRPNISCLIGPPTNPSLPTPPNPTIKTSTISSLLLALPKTYPKWTSPSYSLTPNLTPQPYTYFLKFTNLAAPVAPSSPPMVPPLNVSLPTSTPTSNLLLNPSPPMSRILTTSLIWSDPYPPHSHLTPSWLLLMSPPYIPTSSILVAFQLCVSILSSCETLYQDPSRKVMLNSASYSPLYPRFVGSNLAGVEGFFQSEKSWVWLPSEEK